MARRYSLKEIANAYGYTSSGTYKHIQKLKKLKKFKKTGIGKYYSIYELRILEKLLDFKFEDFKKSK